MEVSATLFRVLPFSFGSSQSLFLKNLSLDGGLLDRLSIAHSFSAFSFGPLRPGQYWPSPYIFLGSPLVIEILNDSVTFNTELHRTSGKVSKIKNHV